jgi:N-acetylglucosaminyldiphosphoundecaprenol N-acetyl-beta-D-mannosaminyltransferase
MSVEIQRVACRVVLDGLAFDALTEREVVAHVRAAVDRGAGGRIVTPNVDILRTVREDRALRSIVARADLVLADGAPLVWTARLAGTPLPERVSGSNLIWSLSEGLAQDGRSVYVLGGLPARRPGLASPTRAYGSPASPVHRSGSNETRTLSPPSARTWSRPSPTSSTSDSASRNRSG